MDIAKYIGLFLLKNNFVYLHGLGNLELKKKPARYEGDALHSPEYDVVLTPGGSIDDTLANFIATHEQTSISKAANALRDFSTATRAEFAAGRDVEVPGVGKFVEVSGMPRFVANPHLQHTPAPVPMIRMAKRTEEQPDFSRDTQDGNSRKEIAWGKVALVAVLVVAVVAAAIFAYRSFSNSSGPTATITTGSGAVVNTPLEAANAPQIPPMDTAHVPLAGTAKPTTAAPVANNGEFTVVLNTYSSRLAAERRVKTLTSNGNKVEVTAKDSATFYVTMRVPMAAADTTRSLDSLRRFFNPKGVYILR